MPGSHFGFPGRGFCGFPHSVQVQENVELVPKLLQEHFLLIQGGTIPAFARRTEEYSEHACQCVRRRGPIRSGPLQSTNPWRYRFDQLKVNNVKKKEPEKFKIPFQVLLIIRRLQWL
jgi:hypothetical protein